MDFDVDDEVTEYDRIRAQNIKEFEAMLSEWQDDIDESVKDINDCVVPKQSNKKRKRESKGDPTFFFTGALPLERRRSDRLLNINPQYSVHDLEDEEDIENRNNYTDDIDDLEKVVFRKRPSYYRKSVEAAYMPVEKITEEYLENIATRVMVKVYSPANGTSCHQCRQKTLDSKTFCRSGRCIGVRGQFCGVCLKNRYGEDAREALLNPKWECPPCRGLCNCSICRTRQGKRPTGILAPLAFQYGHKSVKDFLLSLNGVGDFANETSRKDINKKSHKHNHKKYSEEYFMDVIGFTDDLKPMWVSKNKSLEFRDDFLVGFNEDKEPVMIKL